MTGNGNGNNSIPYVIVFRLDRASETVWSQRVMDDAKNHKSFIVGLGKVTKLELDIYSISV
jgi:hypothetical protein